MTESNGDKVDPADADEQTEVAERIAMSPGVSEAVRRAVSSYATSSAFAHGSFAKSIADSHRRILSITQPLRAFDEAFSGNLPRITQAVTNATALSKWTGFDATRALSPVASSLASSSALDPDWFKQFTAAAGGIDSDIFKTYALAQPNLTGIASALVQNTDFGQGPLAEALASFGNLQSAWLGGVADAFARIRPAFYPKNLRDIDDISLELVEEVVMVDGISLYGVPGPDVAEALLFAGDATQRRAILGRRWKAISTDCREFAETVVDGPLRDHAALLIPALDALDAGNHAAAQALGATVVDSILRSRVEKRTRSKYLPDKGGVRIANYDKLGVRQFIAFAPIWQAYQRFDPDAGESVPTRFSRHATAHTASRRQFNRRNAVQGILLACGLLNFFDEYGQTAVAATP